jgi:hypothetical protein
VDIDIKGAITQGTAIFDYAFTLPQGASGTAKLLTLGGIEKWALSFPAVTSVVEPVETTTTAIPLDAGYYLLTVEVTGAASASGKAPGKARRVQVVHLYSAQTTRVAFDFTNDPALVETPAGSADVGVGYKPPVEALALSGPNTVAKGKTLTLAVANAADFACPEVSTGSTHRLAEGLAFRWFLNGNELAERGATLDLDTAPLAPGMHTASVIGLSVEDEVPFQTDWPFEVTLKETAPGLFAGTLADAKAWLAAQPANTVRPSERIFLFMAVIIQNQILKVIILVK